MNNLIGSPLRAGILVALLGGLTAPARPAGAEGGGDPTISSTNTAPSDPSSRTIQGTDRATEITGPVRLVEPSTHTIYLKNATKALHVHGDTKVTKNGSDASIEDVQEGDQVRASYSGSGGDVSVDRLEVLPPRTERDDRSRTGAGEAGSARSEIDPKLAAPSSAPSGQSGGQLTQKLSR